MYRSPRCWKCSFSRLRLLHFASPRVLGEAGAHGAQRNAVRVRGSLSANRRQLNLRKRPLTPTLSPQERGERELELRTQLRAGHQNIAGDLAGAGDEFV